MCLRQPDQAADARPNRTYRVLLKDQAYKSLNAEAAKRFIEVALRLHVPLHDQSVNGEAVFLVRAPSKAAFSRLHKEFTFQVDILEL